MPRTFGRNGIHVSQVAGWSLTDRPLIEVAPAEPDETDHRIAELIAERIPNRATVQAGIGAVPNAVLSALRNHRDLGVHTELLSDGVIDLVESGVITGVYKGRTPNRMATTFALGTRRLYDFLHENPVVQFLPVDFVNDPRVIAQQPLMVSINATTEVDLLGQAASETVGGRYYSGSGGQADFARGAMFSEGGQGFLVTRSTGDERHAVEDRVPPRLRVGRDHAEEHRRQGGHRVGRCGAARQHAARARRPADRDRASRSPRLADPPGPRARLPLSCTLRIAPVLRSELGGDAQLAEQGAVHRAAVCDAEQLGALGLVELRSVELDRARDVLDPAA